MMNHRQNELVIVDSLKRYLSTQERPCEVVRQNQVAEIPPYPYASYTFPTPVAEHQGTYSENEDGTLYKSVLQTLSITVQSDDQDEALELAMKAYDFFSVVGVALLADNGITVRRVRDVTTRDSLLSIQYEYRNGLDVTFGLLYEIKPDAQMYRDEIESIKLKEV